MTRYQKDLNLKNVANTIFKGIVKDAYFLMDNDLDDDEIEHIKGVISKNIVGGELRYDDVEIILEFNNDAIVKFSASEWSAMRAISKEYLQSCEYVSVFK